MKSMPTFKTIKIQKKKINVEIADTYMKRAFGLMLRKKGRMLFPFTIPLKYGIWMAFMLVPLDIIFADKNGKITNIVENAKPINFNPSTWKIFFSTGFCKYVVEVEAGFVKKNRIKVGQKISGAARI